MRAGGVFSELDTSSCGGSSAAICFYIAQARFDITWRWLGRTRARARARTDDCWASQRACEDPRVTRSYGEGEETERITHIGDLLARSAARFPSRPALQSNRQSLTYSELADLVNATKQDLRGHGIGPGDRVLIVGTNGVRDVALLFALSAARGVAGARQRPRRGAAAGRESFGTAIRDCHCSSGLSRTMPIITRWCVPLKRSHLQPCRMFGANAMPQRPRPNLAPNDRATTSRH